MNQNEKIVIAMVGLPARGKSYIARKVARYLNWTGLKATVFNIGMYRRHIVGIDCDSNFFDPNNKDAIKARENCAIEAVNDLIAYLKGIFKSNLDDGDIAILDGTNTKVDRRMFIKKYLSENLDVPYKLIWLESICNDKVVIEKNILKTKITSPDYKNWNDLEMAAEDFRKRIKEYEKVYESVSVELDGPEAAYIQIINQGVQMVLRNIKGYVQSKLISYLINLHTGDRPIYFARPGETESETLSKLGGDKNLTDNGVRYAEYLANFFKNESLSFINFQDKPKLYCSTMKRSLETGEKLSFLNEISVMKTLDELNIGLRDDMTLEEIERNHPNEYEELMKDPLRYRFPRGESYMDLIHRIEPMIYELERRKGPIIIIAHLGIIRCLYGYFTCAPLDLIPKLNIPNNTVIKFIPEAYGFTEERFTINMKDGCVINDPNRFLFNDQLNHIPG
jgi:broad specificity phosphatase PhoE/predicted kinase